MNNYFLCSFYTDYFNSDVDTLSKEDKLENKDKSLKRIPTKYINAKIKAFKIVVMKYRNRRKRFGLRLNLICVLVNFDRGLFNN